MLPSEAKEHFKELSDTVNPYTGFRGLASHLTLVSVVFFYIRYEK